MQVTVLEQISLVDGDDPQKGRVPLGQGTYEIEPITNPFGHIHMGWWALHGTRHGLTPAAWNEHQAKGHIRITGVQAARQSAI